MKQTDLEKLLADMSLKEKVEAEEPVNNAFAAALKGIKL